MMTMTTFSRRSVQAFSVSDLTQFKQQMLYWANQFSVCCFLDNNLYQHSNYHSYECLLAVNPVTTFDPQTNDILPALSRFLQAYPNDWLFGHFTYHSTQPSYSAGTTHLTDGVSFPVAFLFQPETVVELKNQQVVISTFLDDPELIFTAITQSRPIEEITAPVAIQARFSRDEYLDAVNSLLGHIQRGDCYEINFCQEFYATNTRITPVTLYQRLTRLSPTPYAAFYKLDHQYALCASPERYIRREGNTLISQPIKGTAKRVHGNEELDKKAKEDLLASQKERSENVMVVDLVRNDFSRICIPGSVFVEELFGIYSFPQVHQMISTIKGSLPPGTGLSEILEATFPMGSMTGAPKKRVMELTNLYERTRRGLYSGCIGYIRPDGDFDFNVVIRSVLYNADEKYVSYQVGGGITFYSDAVKEYEECLLKASAIRKVLE